MRFRAFQCWFPRDPTTPRDYEDASAHSEKLGRAVIADGVSSAIFSRTWARLLTQHALMIPPRYEDDAAFVDWLAPLQRAWASNEGVQRARGDWVRGPKVRSTGGQATFLLMDIEPLATHEKQPAEYRLSVSAIGDSILYLVRDGEKVLSFPLTESAEFSQPPHVLSSIAKDVPYIGRFQRLEERCREGDLLVLCTDAIGKWSMQEYESGINVDWMRYWDNETAWQDDILRLRAKHANDPGNRLVVDDCTLLLMKVVPELISEGEPAAALDRSDTPFALVSSEIAPSPPVQTDATATPAAPMDPSEPAVSDAPSSAESQAEHEVVDSASTPDSKTTFTPDPSPTPTTTDPLPLPTEEPHNTSDIELLTEHNEVEEVPMEGDHIEGGVTKWFSSKLTRLFQPESRPPSEGDSELL